MYINSANPSGNPAGLQVKSCPLSVISCGHYKLKDCEVLPVIRPKGRIDYQLIYIASGAARFTFKPSDSEKLIQSGNCILYTPREYQHYSFCGEDNAEVYWIHFSGSEVRNLLRQYHLISSDKVYYVGFLPECIELFRYIISELQLQHTYTDTVVANMLSNILIYFSRAIETPLAVYSEANIEFEKINEYFRKHYQEQISIDDYAKANNVSVSTLNRIVKKHTGYTPLQFLLQIRLDNAKELLRLTDFSVNIISSMIGYDNSLYFSRLFHKHIGKTPSDYRKNNILI